MKLRSVIKNKKGIALNQAFGAILALVLVAVLVIIGIVLFVSLNTGPFANLETVTITGESLTPTGDGVLVSNSTRCNFGSFGIGTATNSSGGLMDAGNYTTTGAGLVTNTTPLNAGNNTGTPWTLNYTYGWGTAACEAAQSTIVQFGTYPVLIGLVGTIIFLGLVIGVLVASFVFGRRESV